ncbi:Gag polyprotein [Rhynchospora pubera]|uniref:Gag polyprotein n=1 Tax=Rhynchospora pubera TaxID=906938 RepID=A0AAV8FDS1_9POAL|nr:Gag polyprotein [Rhynchospora pubera]
MARAPRVIPNDPPSPMREERNTTNLDAVLQGLERIVRNAAEVRPREGNDFFELYRSFSSLRPSNFDGTGDFLAAEDWLADIQDKFRLVRAPEVNQVELAAQLLVGHARFWWQEAKRRYNGNLELIPWEWFKRQFEGRYLDMLSRENLRQKFLNLKQGEGSVAEFNSKFEDLMRYAPDVANDQFRLRQQYLRGLNPRLAQLIDRPGLDLLPDLMSQAATVESYETRINHAEISRNVRPKVETPKIDLQRNENSEGNKPWCRRCLKPHPESECRVLSGLCFNCNEHGHLARNCPKNRQHGTRNNQVATPQNNGGRSVNISTRGRLFGGGAGGQMGVHNCCCAHTLNEKQGDVVHEVTTVEDADAVTLKPVTGMVKRSRNPTYVSIH